MQIDASIKNIIFDFGGVILNIDYKLTENAFAKLGLNGFDKIYCLETQKDFFDVFEKGLISPMDFRKEVRKSINKAVTDSQIDASWNSMLLDVPEDRIQLLSKLKKYNRLFLLSNTNAIHFSAYSSYLQSKFNRDIFSDLFEKAYFSCRINMRKPDAEIFELVLTENNLRKKETLFIDDSIQNIEGAKRVGLNVILLEKGKTILDLFT